MYQAVKYLKSLFSKDSNSFNTICYLWNRNRWMLDPKAYFDFYSDVKIENPVFLIGNQGAGLTLFSRILRRNLRVVNVTGNSSYWAGADEMMSVYEPILTRELSGIFLNSPKHSFLTPPRGWSYASKDLIDEYRKTEKDANCYQSRKLRNAIGLALTKHGKDIKKPVFVDKSQVLSVKMSFINELLKGSNPRFIHMTRNPYAAIYRAAIGRAADIERYSQFLSLDYRIKLCTEHWLNVAKSIEEDKEKVDNYLHFRFEDLLQSPKRITCKACDFIQIGFQKDMIPQAHHRLPFGIRGNKKWYPLRRDVNRQYLKDISPKHYRYIKTKCGIFAENYGYNPISL